MPFIVDNYNDFYTEFYQVRLAQKLGLQDEGASDADLLRSQEEKDVVAGFWKVMEKTGCDFTNGFRELAGVSKSAEMTP